MPRTAVSVAPDAIRIEDEVWQEAFAQDVRRRPRATAAVTRTERTARTERRPRPVSAPRERRSVREAPVRMPEAALAIPDFVNTTPSLPSDSGDTSSPRAQARRPTPTARKAADAAPAALAAPPTRRTVVIKGRGAERNLPWETSARRPNRLPHHRTGFRPDRVAMWAVFLGFLLVLVAAMSGHS